MPNQSLWSLITLSDGSPFRFSALCLERSGTTPLDIEISLSNNLWGRQFHPEPGVYMYLNALLDGLAFIVARGGGTSRWRSFWLYTPENVRSIEPQMAALDFIGKHPLPALERLEVKYDGSRWNTLQEIMAKTFPNRTLLHDPSSAHLRVATLDWVPNSYIFASPDQPQLVGLTRLEIKFPIALPKLEHINTLLAASPLLRVLTIDTTLHHYTGPPDPEDRRDLIVLPRIKMPNLRALALLFSIRESLLWWEYKVLRMLDAPNVESFRLRLESPGSLLPYNREIVDYIIKGADPSNPRPLFPSLTGVELYIQRYKRFPSPFCDKFDEEILSTYPTITTLILPRGVSSSVLQAKPWLVPCLNRLFIFVGSSSDLEEAICERCAAGMGPKTVEVAMRSQNIASEYKQPECWKEVEELGVDVRTGYSERRVREALGFETYDRDREWSL